jgi:hypothetical protein
MTVGMPLYPLMYTLVRNPHTAAICVLILILGMPLFPLMYTLVRNPHTAAIYVSTYYS